MAAYEWTVVSYFSGLTLAAWLAPVETRRRLQATAIGVAVLLITANVATMAPSALRAWIPHIYLVTGYWMPALLLPSVPGRRFEDWLVRSDLGLRLVLPSVPTPLVHLVELAYLLCYPLVPLSFAVVWLNGSAADIGRFWLAVLLSGYGCYVSLPWLVSRPPRARHEFGETRGGLPRLNSRVLGRLSHRLNTFPSGHVAVAAASAASVATVSMPAGIVFGLVVAAITVGAAAGRYHYVIDVILGWGIAAAAVAVAHIA